MRLPSGFVPPTSSELLSNQFSNKIGILCMYFIEFAANFDTFSPCATTPNLKNTIQGYLAQNSLFSTIPGVQLEQVLIWSCPNCTVGGNAPAEVNIGGMILTYNDTTFIVLRGTATCSNCEPCQDVNSVLVTPAWITNANVKVHIGFNNIYTGKNIQTTTCSTYTYNSSLQDQIRIYLTTKQPNNIIVTGHSLGGALCYLISADLTLNYSIIRNKAKFYSAAGPPSGNSNFMSLVNFYPGFFALANICDKVPNMPVNLTGYSRMPTGSYCFSAPGNIATSPHDTTNSYKFVLANNYNFNSANGKTGSSNSVFNLSCPNSGASIGSTTSTDSTVNCLPNCSSCCVYNCGPYAPPSTGITFSYVPSKKCYSQS